MMGVIFPIGSITGSCMSNPGWYYYLSLRGSISPLFAVREPRHSYIAHSSGTLTLLLEGTSVTLSSDE